MQGLRSEEKRLVGKAKVRKMRQLTKNLVI
jgi:hypothetical protein